MLWQCTVRLTCPDQASPGTGGRAVGHTVTYHAKLRTEQLGCGAAQSLPVGAWPGAGAGPGW